MTLMTPFTALAPHNVAPGPLVTSIRSTSARGTSCTSQNTAEYSGVYTVRPSIRTSSLLAVVLLNPRALMAHCRESTCATCRLVARRRASGRLVTPERRMSSWVMTWMAEATCVSLSGRFETEVTSTFMSCSMLSFFRESADRLESGRWALLSGRWANPDSANETRPTVKRIAVPAATLLMGTLDLIPAQVALPGPNRGDPCHLARTGLGKDRRADAEDGLAGHSTTGRFCGREGRRCDTSLGCRPERASVQRGGSFKRSQ